MSIKGPLKFLKMSQQVLVFISTETLHFPQVHTWLRKCLFKIVLSALMLPNQAFTVPWDREGLKSYVDVVFGPVDGPDGYTQATQAALIHGTGDGAAQAGEAPQSKTA